MSNLEKYEELQSKLPEIADTVKEFPRKLQEKVFDTLVSTLINEDTLNKSSPHITKPTYKPDKNSDSNKDSNKFPGVATYKKGTYHFTARDLKASSKKDATFRLVYVLIHTYMKLTGKEGVSRKEIITPTLKKWRLYDGNARNYISNDKGILSEDDLYSLNQPATLDALKYIKEIQDDSITGSWSPSRASANNSNSSDD